MTWKIGDLWIGPGALGRIRLAVSLLLAGLLLQALAYAGIGREQYYRGVYDTCLLFIPLESVCLSNTAAAAWAGWFEQESPGWRWPVLRENHEPAAGVRR